MMDLVDDVQRKLLLFLGSGYTVNRLGIYDSATGAVLNENQAYAALMDAGEKYYITMAPHMASVASTDAQGYPIYRDGTTEWHCGMKHGQAAQFAAFDTDKINAIIKCAIQLPDVQGTT